MSVDTMAFEDKCTLAKRALDQLVQRVEEYERSLNEAVLTRVLGRIRIHGEFRCWLWTGARVANPRGGYGKVKIQGKVHRVHRWLYKQLMKEEPPPLLDHMCRLRPCCNPGHVQAATVQENTKLGLSGLQKKKRKLDVCR